MLELYHWEPNGYSLSPLTALYEKGVAFESRYLDFPAFELCGQQAFGSEDEFALNLELEAPVLVADGRPLTDTFFIGLFLDDAHTEGPRLAPPDPAGHWRVLAWGRHIGEVLAPAVTTLGCHAFLAPVLAQCDGDELRSKIAALPTEERRTGWRVAAENAYTDEILSESRRKLGLSVRKVEEALAGGEWVCGAFSLVDIELFAHLNSAPLLAPQIAGAATAPRLMDWLDRMRARPSHAMALAHARSAEPRQAFAPGAEHSRWG